MKKISQSGGVALALALLFSPAIAAPGLQSRQAQNQLPLEKISVFCGATGCQPITKVKKCAPDNQNHVATNGQRQVVARRTCNFF